MTKYDESYIGKKFNHWTVLDVVKPSSTRNGVGFKVQCDCPHKMIKIRPASYVVGGQTKGCKHCRGKDLTGKMYGYLLAIEQDRERSKNENINLWKCRCTYKGCGKIVSVGVGALHTGKQVSCGCKRVRDLVGQKFNKLLVVSEASRSSTNRQRWNCVCDCEGKTGYTGKSISRTDALVNGTTKSCGCNNYTHGYGTIKNKTNRRIYSIWRGMKKRCYNKNDTKYSSYGGRGIKVCDEWNTNDPKPFVEWALANGHDKSLTLDRIDNDGNYEPNNCRWTDKATQSNNTRKSNAVNSGIRKHMTKSGRVNYGINVGTAYLLPRYASEIEAIDARNLYIIDHDLLIQLHPTVNWTTHADVRRNITNGVESWDIFSIAGVEITPPYNLATANDAWLYVIREIKSRCNIDLTVTKPIKDKKHK